MRLTMHRARAVLHPTGLAEGESDFTELAMPASLIRRGHEVRLVVVPEQGEAPARVDATMIQLLARAERAHRMLTQSVPADRAKRAELVRLARLRTLAPDIVTAILDGRQPPSLTARSLLRTSELPLGWVEQRVALGFA